MAVITVIIVAAVYWQTYARIIDMWAISDFQHGWLVFPLFLYVLYRKREALAATPWDKSTPGFALVVALVVVWLLARVTGV